MSLYKQLLIFIFALFLLLLSGTLLVNFNSTQQYLTDQLDIQIEDTVTSLGLTLGPYLFTNDVSAIETTVNAIFDRGYYREISVTDIDDNILVIREQPVVVQGVPGWFIGLIDIETPEVIREISSGWALTGDIKVVGHAGFAYQQLWKVVYNSLIWFLVAFGALMLFGNKTLRVLLKPLEAVRVQAEAICRREREEIPLPRTLELRTVVMAMNKMTRHVKNMFEEQAGVGKHLREMAYQDALTGLGNRRYFKTQLQSRLADSEQFKPGALFLLQCHDFAGFNNRQGYEAGDAVLVKVSEIVQQITLAYKEKLFCRMTGAEFALIIDEIPREKAETLAREISHALSQLFSRGLYDEPNVIHLALVMIDQPQEFGVMLLSKADEALRAARSKGENAWQLYQQAGSDGLLSSGGQKWLTFLADRIRALELTLLVQKAVDCREPNKLLHNEALIQLSGENDKVYSAGQFMGSAEQLGMTGEIDRFVLNSVVKLLQERAQQNPELQETFAINLSVSALTDKDFTAWMLEKLDELPGPDSAHQGVAPKRLILEVSEAVAINNLELLRDLSQQLRKRGHGLGLDHFGRGFSHFGYLNTLKPDYVKIDRAYTTGIESTPDNQFFVNTLCTICRNLEITVIALAVENQSQWDCLRNLNVDGIQGYVIGRPEALTA